MSSGPAVTSERSLMDLQRGELQPSRLLPAPPDGTGRLLALMRDPDVTLPALATAITGDRGLAGRLLPLVNLAFGAGAHPTGTVNRALVILGFGAVRGAALAMSVADRFAGMPRASGLPLYRFWHHGLATGCLARALAEHCRAGDPDDAFAAGLLHDTGKLVLADRFPADVAALCGAARENRLTWLAGEEALFPIDHAALARALFEAWDFPEAIVEAVACHHRPRAACRHAGLAAAVHAADVLAGRAGRRCPGARPPAAAAPEAHVLLGLDDAALQDLLARSRDEIARVAEALPLLT